MKKSDRNKNNDLQNMNLSPAARRRLEKGKREGERYHTQFFSIDMSDEELIEAWEREEKRDWTKQFTDVKIEDYEEEPRVRRKRKQSRQGEETSDRRKQDSRQEQGRGSKRDSRQEQGRGSKRDSRQEQGRGSKRDSRQDVRREATVKADFIGMMISNVQIGCSLLFLVSLLVLNIFPILYLAVIIVVLSLLVVWVRRAQKYRKRWRHGKKVFSILVSLGLVTGAYFSFLFSTTITNMGGENTATLNLSRDTYNVYISGIDVFGELEQASRSDVNLISTINPKTGQVLLTTTPRDYYVVIPGISGDQKDKLTHAGNYGVEASMDTLEAIYEESIPYYLRVNFTSFINVIDALGGVTVNSAEAFVTQDGVEIVKGENRLNGTEALAFSRERYGLEDGDVQRGKNHEIMIQAIVREMLKPTTLLSMDEVLASVETNVETNLSSANMRQIIKGMLKSGLFMDIKSVDATGTPGREYCYSYKSKSLYVTIPDPNSIAGIKALMNDVEDGKDLPKE